MTKTFNRGQKVKCIFGKVWTVLNQSETTVWVYENNSTIHASKLVAL